MISPFQTEVYQLTKKIPTGKITTYQEISKKLNTSPRAVGQALKRSPGLPQIPCHRIINSNGSLGGFNQGIDKKIKLLKKEGIIINNKINLKKYLHHFKTKTRQQ